MLDDDALKNATSIAVLIVAALLCRVGRLCTATPAWHAPDENTASPNEVGSRREQHARDPDPTDGEESVRADPNVTLTWKLGDLVQVELDASAVRYEIYYGTDFADVNERDSSDLYVLEHTTAEIGPLADETGYFWRVDTLLERVIPPYYTTLYRGEVWSFTTAPPPKVISVDDDGPADFNTIQAAIDSANDSDVVILRPGTYTGHGNRDIDFLGKAITVRSTDPNDPNIVAATIIDCNASSGDPHRGFIFQNGESHDSVLDGLTITRAYGGGVHCTSASPAIRNCTISWCRNEGDGGGMYAKSADLVLTNCTFTHNTAKSGAGIYNHGGGGVITDCVFSFNQAHGGGGLYKISSEDVVLAGCKFINNKAVYGGALISYGHPILARDCRFTGNRANDGAAVCGLIQMTNCLVAGNSADTCGGAVSGMLTAVNCTFAANRALGSQGGQLFLNFDHSRIVNCILWSDPPTEPNIISLEGGTRRIPALTIKHSNLAQGQSSIHVTGRSTLNWGPGNISADPCFADPGLWDPNGTADEPNDDFRVGGDYHLKSQGGRWDSAGQEWIIDDATSPSIDTGEPMIPVGDEQFANGGRINMGAYGGTPEASKSYFAKAPCRVVVAGDINGDCIVDFKDFDLMALHWLENRGPVMPIPDLYFYSGQGKTPLRIYPQNFAICFKETVGEERIRELVEGDYMLDEVVFAEGLTYLRTKPGTTDSDIIRAVQRFERLDDVKYASPVFGDFTAKMILTDEFSAKFTTGREKIDELNALYNVEIVRYHSSLESYLLRVKDPKNYNTLKTANIYYENSITEYASPNFTMLIRMP